MKDLGIQSNVSHQNGEYAKALEFAKKALPLAPNDASKQAVQGMIDRLAAGRDIN